MPSFLSDYFYCKGMFLKFQQYLRDDTMIKAMPLVIFDGISHSCKMILSLSYQLFLNFLIILIHLFCLHL